ncbi:hypothetical protein [Maribacter litoralis]|uniref:hypothetical protein n=1 Tax=Maribacter litoralis TaxID=2059726 RepID=UPI003F5CF0B8
MEHSNGKNNMTNFKIILVFFLFINVSFSQSLEETIEWIGRNSSGREQIEYDKNENILYFFSLRRAGNNQATFVNAINPVDVNSISLKYGQDGWNSVKLNFKKGGTIVTKYWLNEKSEIEGEPTETKMYGFDISLNCSKELIEKYKKAFLHLFKELGIEVKDGDYF